MDIPLLSVNGLCVSAGERSLLEDVSYELAAGECLAVGGESGAGKTLSVTALMGLLPPTLAVSGSARFCGEELVGNPARQRELSGKGMLFLVQQPLSAFDPLVTVGNQLLETARAADPRAPSSGLRASIEQALARLRLEHPAEIMRKFPCELSGGMLQRCMVSLITVVKPRLVIADEPTSALDVLSAREVGEEFRFACREVGASLIVITHDLGLAQLCAEKVLVLRQGRVVESGTADVLRHPKHPYTRYLAGTKRFMARAAQQALGGGHAGD